MNQHWTDAAVAVLDPVDERMLVSARPLGQVSDEPVRLRNRRRWPALLGASVLLVGGTTAYAAVQRGGGDTHITNLQCETPSANINGHVVTGDPIADCAAIWKRTETTPVPALVAYVFDNVTYYVQSASLPAPTDPRMRPLVTGIKTDPSIGEFNDALNDRLAGPLASCMSTEKARTIITSIATRLKLTSVPVKVLQENGRPRLADGVAMCATAFLNSDARQTSVALLSYQSGPGIEGNSSIKDFLARLRVADSCQALPAKLRAVQDAASASGLDPDPTRHEVVIDTIAEPAATCTRVYVELGGAVFVSLRGAAGG